MNAARRAPLVVLAAALGAGCTGPGSAFDPAGAGAGSILRLFWGLTIGFAVVWAAVVALSLHAARPGRAPISRAAARRLVLWGGAIVPATVLTGVLVIGLGMIPDLVATAPEGARRIEVVGHQWWWRVRYLEPDREPIELANELRLAVGEPVEIELSSPDVIHSFWIPALGGKVDMIPGRRTRLRLQPMRTGTFRGLCAEYCGVSHALMTFHVVVDDRAGFDAWLAGQAAPAVAPPDEEARRGARAFLASGCGGCHAVRGTEADGTIGPDLTHVGGRAAIGAGALPNRREALRRWVAHTDAVKPAVLMPSYEMLPAGDLDAIAAYLEGLE